MQTKPFRASTTFRGLIVALLPILAMRGIEIRIDELVELGNQISNIYLLATSIAGIIVAWYGRVKAKKSITL